MFENQNGSNMVMPVSPMGNGNGGGFFGDDSWWIIILFILLWGNNGWGNGNQNCMNGLYPWMNQSQQVSDGFRDQMLQNTMSDLRTDVNVGFGNVQQSLCSGFAGVNATVQNGFAQAEIANNARQIADMNQQFAMQTAMMQGQNAIQNQVAQTGCDNKNQGMMNTRDIIENANRNNQAILDKLCQLELDGVKGQLAQAQRENVGLQNQLNMAAMRESQTAQNAFIQQGFANEVDQLYNRLNNCPVPTTPVYGRAPIFTCNQQGCGCGAA